MKKSIFGVVLAGFAYLTLAHGALAQQFEEKTTEQQLSELNWMRPGSVGRIADKAEFQVADGLTFLGAIDTDKFLKLNGNPPQGDAYTIASLASNWFGVLSFQAEGYVKDDEEVDAEQLLAALKEGNRRGNENRRQQGLPTMTLEGWYFPPRYDAVNKRLEWGIKFHNEQNEPIVNVQTKILGRSGYTTAILVTEPETMERDLVEFKEALKNFEYVRGEKYSEWKEGDKVAAYGLGALVLGGAAAAATSKGGIKAVGAAILAGLAALWAGIKRLVGRKA